MERGQALSIGFFYLAAANTALSRVAGTCTQGDADRLYGVFLSILLYSVAMLGLWLSGRRRSVLLFILPIAPVIFWQTWFSVRLSFEILVLNRTACHVLKGLPYPSSGSELIIATAWPLMSAGVLLGVLLICRRPSKT